MQLAYMSQPTEHRWKKKSYFGGGGEVRKVFPEDPQHGTNLAEFC